MNLHLGRVTVPREIAASEFSRKITMLTLSACSGEGTPVNQRTGAADVEIDYLAQRDGNRADAANGRGGRTIDHVLPRGGQRLLGQLQTFSP